MLFNLSLKIKDVDALLSHGIKVFSKRLICNTPYFGSLSSLGNEEDKCLKTIKNGQLTYNLVLGDILKYMYQNLKFEKTLQILSFDVSLQSNTDRNKKYVNRIQHREFPFI